MCVLKLTDGHSNVSCIEYGNVPKLGEHTPPGSKVRVDVDKVRIVKGMWLLDAGNTEVMGGEVDGVTSSWLARQEIEAKRQFGDIPSGKAPPFTPFTGAVSHRRKASKPKVDLRRGRRASADIVGWR